MKFLVDPPVALVPFQLAEICSALGKARALRAFKLAEEWNDFARRGLRRGMLRTAMVGNEMAGSTT